MRKVKQVARIVLWIALGLCFALGAWLLRPAAKRAFADEGDPAAKQEVQISGLRASGWEWNSFDRTLHIIQGQASNGAEITYTISCVAPVKAGETVEDVTFTWSQLATSAVINAIKALPAGEYTLTATTEETATDAAATATENFTIRTALNSWLISPSMLSWATNDFNAENLPVAGSAYGEVDLFLTREKTVNDATVQKLYTRHITTVVSGPNGYYVAEAVEGDTNVLNKLASGTYYLQARVADSEGEYRGLSTVVPVKVFAGSDSRPENKWLDNEMPSMHPYVSEYQTPSVPKGATLRWTEMRYEYYLAKEEDGDFVPTGDPVCVQTKKKDNSDNLEIISGEMPMKPAWYFVRMIATYKENGVVVEEDTRECDVLFQVREAINEWTQTPHIANWYLSEEPSVPTFGETTYLSDVTFMYKEAGADDSTAVAQQPTKEGKYVMIATARALLSLENNVPTYSQYCKSVSTEIPFTVSLAKNGWLTIPTLNGWSEEFAPNDPIAEAEHGTVTYTYYRADGTKLDGRPEEEGDYILRATVEADGYITLEDEVEFTIASAWDETFLIIDIVLVLVASALTVVVIIFAKRRLSQC